MARRKNIKLAKYLRFMTPNDKTWALSSLHIATRIRPHKFYNRARSATNQSYHLDETSIGINSRLIPARNIRRVPFVRSFPCFLGFVQDLARSRGACAFAPFFKYLDFSSVFDRAATFYNSESSDIEMRQGVVALFPTKRTRSCANSIQFWFSQFQFKSLLLSSTLRNAVPRRRSIARVDYNDKGSSTFLIRYLISTISEHPSVICYSPTGERLQERKQKFCERSTRRNLLAR